MPRRAAAKPAKRSTQPTAKPAAKRRKPAPTAAPKLSRTRRPADLDVAEWQSRLRRQFGREQAFVLDNLGADPVFSDFRVTNPASRSRYRVTIRGRAPGLNACTCPDFATNQLGTCKHVEFVLGKLERRRGAKAALAKGFQTAYSEVWLDRTAAAALSLRPGTDCPPALLEAAAAAFAPADADASAAQRLDGLERLARLAAEHDHELRIRDEAWRFVAEARDAEHRRVLLAQAYPKGAEDPALAGLLQAGLYPYQAEGALFAVRAGRALIGDEMGLGKTVQAIAAAELFARHFGVGRVLVVCPTSLKHQWKREIQRFTGRDALVIHGLRALRQRQYTEDAFCKITNYDTLARDADLIDAWAPELVVADEAQRIKNWDTIAARALKRIESPYAVVLTGTPLENRLEELISIVQFVDRHRLGPTWRLLDAHQLRDESGRVVGYRALDRIARTLAPVMLRRRKAEVLTQLPDRVVQRIFVPLTPQQRVHHDENGEIVTRIVARWRKTGFLSDADQRRLQCALQNMRMACNSTWLLDRETDHGHKVDELMTLLDELFEDPQAKAVVFSQWIGTHELIERRLAPRGWGHVRFTGEVPGEQRGALVERFHADPGCRLFLSTDAGGVGLNLQHAAAVVVNMDLPWNPAVLEQRIGRVHRMGQQRGVQVIDFVGQGSIEEGMLSVLAFKTSLFAGVLDGGASEVFLQGTRLSKFMESVEEVAGAMGEAETDEPAAAGAANEPAAAPAGAHESAVAVEARAGAAAATSPAGAMAAEAGAGTGAAARPGTAGEPAAAMRTDSPGAPPAAASAAGPDVDPWAAILEAGASLLQGLAAARSESGAAPIAIEPDPVTGRPTLRLPLPDPSVLQRLAKAFEPWLR